MSGILGLLNFDGMPIDPELLQRMTDSLVFRGPDAKSIWNRGHVGFGHTLLKTTYEAERERQPFSLDGQVWIVADARIDAWQELIEKLRMKGSRSNIPPLEIQGGGSLSPNIDSALGETDVELILRAYHTWGEECVEHLLGDFAFAVWNGHERRLFCARDQMGVKPFYYAHVGQTFIFSNTLNCLRIHPAISDRLNDLAIADFLMFECNQDPATTSFADIRRIPPAHCLSVSSGRIELRQYWKMPMDEPVFHRRPGDYLDQFKSLLQQAISDRLRTRRIGVLMSGGLDSPSLAAVTCDLQRSKGARGDLKAFTRVASYGPDEGFYAQEAARHLGIPIVLQHLNGESDGPEGSQNHIHTPEPVSSPWQIPLMREHWTEMSAFSRVFFYGEGPDNALGFEWRPWVRYLIGKQRWDKLLGSLFAAVFQGPLPGWGRLTRRLRELRYPKIILHECLNPELCERLQLDEARYDRLIRLSSEHPIRPVGYASMHSPLWQYLFETMDAGQTMVPVELRHPYVDLRMVRYMLSVPALPWCRAKYLVRRAMDGMLPSVCLKRGKAGIPIAVALNRIGEQKGFPLAPTPELCHYVTESYLLRAAGEKIGALGDDLRVRGLNYWLKNSWKNYSLAKMEEPNDEPLTTTASAAYGEKNV